MATNPDSRLSAALVTCSLFPDLARDDRLLLDALSAVGVEARPAIWDDPATDWMLFDCAVVRSPWDYDRRPERFGGWIESLERRGARLFNHPRALRWNLHKHYLRDLEGRGLHVAPTEWLEGGRPADLQAILGSRRWRRAVIKPAISAGARRTILVSRAPDGAPEARDEAARAQAALDRLLAKGDVLVQPFLEQIADEGEWSFVFLGGRFSHAVLKRPARSDFRVQERYGGTALRVAAGTDLVDAASRVLEEAAAEVRSRAGCAGPGLAHGPDDPGDFVYARVDAVRDRDRLLLVELEILEPSLFLALDASAPARLATAIAERLRR